MWRMHIADALDWRSRAVMLRNVKVFAQNWRTLLLLPATEPIVFLLAIGVGLGSYVGAMDYHGRTVAYRDYVAPGILTITAFNSAFLEALYGTYVRMFFQKTWQGMIVTQIEMRHIVWGEIMWSGFRALMNTTVVAVVLALLGCIGWLDIAVWKLPLVLPFALVFGVAVGALALVFTAIIPTVDHLNYPVFLVAVPANFFSNTFFPIHTDGAVAALLAVNPVMHLTETYRAMLLSGPMDGHVIAFFVSAAVIFVSGAAIAQTLLTRRLLGE
jgi:lipooligosaccharide transport system permease protein